MSFSTLSTFLHPQSQTLHHPTPPIGEEGWRSAEVGSGGFTPPTGPGRCTACGFHVPTQQHRDGCRVQRRSLQATPEMNAAYRAGLCIDCRQVRYSAGRPRCNECHAAWSGTTTTKGTHA